MGAQIISFITIMLTLVSVAFLAYVMTKFIGKKSMGMIKSKYMKVMDTLSMGFDRTIYLIKVGEQYVLMYSSTKGFEFICNIEPDKIDESMQNIKFNEKKSFSKYFDFFKPGDDTNNTMDDNNIKNNIEKLKSRFNRNR